MIHRLLFVDDEASVLSGFDRLLSLDYKIDTADSGQKGINALHRKGPYSVIFTDMRMPNMNGLEFLKEARAVSPDSIYIMLTGNNDQETAVNAVNEGRVFRFLNKPCEAAELKQTIADATRQFELVRCEKALLENTFVGAVKTLVDVVEVVQEGLTGRSNAIEKKVEQMREALSIEPRWEFKVAARLSPLGIALLPENERQEIEHSPHTEDVVFLALQKAGQITGRLLGDIPRLENVSTICSATDRVTGRILTKSPGNSDELVQVGATLLRIAIHWDFLEYQATSVPGLLGTLKPMLPEIPGELIDAITQYARFGIHEDEVNSTPTDEDALLDCVQLAADELSAGMVAGRHIVTQHGDILVRRGQRLSQAIIEKLGAQRRLPPVWVLRESVLDPSATSYDSIKI